MFCKTCGKEINDNAVICPYCGCAVSGEIKEKTIENSQDKKGKANVMSIIGFVLSLVSLLLSLFGAVAIAGLVLSIIGLVQCNQNGERLKGLAIAGIVVSICSLCYTVYALFVLQTIRMLI